MKKLYFLTFFFILSSFSFAQNSSELGVEDSKNRQSYEIEGFKMYPNPIVNGILFITSFEDQLKEVEIYDILGKRVFSRTLLKGKSRLNISTLKSGVYIIRVRENNKTATRKLVVK
ncbi:MAG: T9SS type A sorting domain-containing protein [Flavobacteriaceae bacterium]|nr:T9SS type A sorting domain-containing protein [Flavobacteriaceae bacterium]